MILDRRTLVLLAATAATFWLSGASAQTWSRYVNRRYGFSIEYPPQFVPGTPPVNGDGNDFTAPDGATFAVSGELNSAAAAAAGFVGDQNRILTISEFETYLLNQLRETVTYRASSAHTIVISGFRGKQVYYEKYIFSQHDQLINSFSMTYPAQLKASYDPIVAHMSASFRSGTPLGKWD